jgi:hypothetical protein
MVNAGPLITKTGIMDFMSGGKQKDYHRYQEPQVQKIQSWISFIPFVEKKQGCQNKPVPPSQNFSRPRNTCHDLGEEILRARTRPIVVLR